MGRGAGVALIGAFVLLLADPAAAQLDFVEGACEIRSISGDVQVDGSTITLTDTQMEAAVSEAAIVRFHDVGFIVKGSNEIPGTVVATIAATGTGKKSQTTDAVAFTSQTTVTDPDGLPDTDDESATPMIIATGLPDTTWVAQGPAQRFSIVGSDLKIRLLFGLVDVDVPCKPGALPVEFAVAQTGGTTTTTTTTTTSAPSTTTTAPPTTTTTAAPTPTTTAPPNNQLPHTGPVRTAVMIVVGVLLLDLGYLATSATRRVG